MKSNFQAEIDGKLSEMGATEMMESVNDNLSWSQEPEVETEAISGVYENMSWSQEPKVETKAISGSVSYPVHVGFSVQMKGGGHIHLSNHQLLLFNSVYSNVGKQFNPKKGKFTKVSMHSCTRCTHTICTNLYWGPQSFELALE